MKRLRHEKFELKVRHVEINAAEIQVFSDPSFATNKYISSQLVYTIFLYDEKGNCYIVSGSSMKRRHVTRSVLAAELYDIAHCYDIGFLIWYTTENVFKRPVKLRVHKDSKTLFESIVSFSSMIEKRFVICTYALREAY